MMWVISWDPTKLFQSHIRCGGWSSLLMCFLTAFFFTCTVDASSPRLRTSCQVGIWSAEESGTNKALPASTPFSWQTNLRARVGVNTHTRPFTDINEWVNSDRHRGRWRAGVWWRASTSNSAVESIGRRTSVLPQCAGWGTRRHTVFTAFRTFTISLSL